MPAPYEKKRLAIDTGTWTAITPPFDCNVIVVINSDSQDFYLRTDSADSATQQTIPSGSQEFIGVFTNATRPFSYRFKGGRTVAYAKAASGTGPLVCTYIE